MTLRWSRKKEHFASLHPSRVAFGLGNTHDKLRERISKAIAKSRMHTWAPGEPIGKECRKRLLVGFATWSLYDLELLDEINHRLTAPSIFRVDVFDVDDVTGAAELSDYYPGFELRGDINPFAGLWIDGLHKETRTGPRAVKFVREVLPFALP